MGLLGMVWRDVDVGASGLWDVGLCVCSGRGPRWDIAKKIWAGGTHEASEQALAALASAGT